MRNTFFLTVLSLLMLGCSGVEVYDLRCEGLENPLGIDTCEPRFSWKVGGDGVSMSAYRIQMASDRESLMSGKADIWDSGRIFSEDPVMVPYSGDRLSSRDECFWRVKVWDGNGRQSGWSEVSRFSVGPLDGLDGNYVGAFEGTDESPVFCCSFDGVEGGEYFVHVNSLGYHELYVNGGKVGDAILAPAVSQMNRRSLIMTYDISDRIIDGKNDISIWAAKGWYRKETFGAGYDGPLVRAQVEMKTDDGWETVLKTDGGWKARKSGYRSPGTWHAYSFIGEVIDAGLYGNEALSSVDVVDVDGGITASPMMCGPNREYEIAVPVSISVMGSGSILAERLWRDCGVCVDGPDSVYLVDMGRNITCQPEYHFPKMPAGTVINAYYADSPDPREMFEHDSFIASGKDGGDVFRLRFNQHSFRYVMLHGLPSRPELSDVMAHCFHTDFRDASSFECSDSDINAIHDMIKHTLANISFSGYQVDCPHIERLGYGGDGNSSTMSMQTMFDASPMYRNWLTAWGDSMREGGSLPHTAPNPYSAGGGPYWCGFVIMAPYRSILNYGDALMAERLYPVMKRWLEYVDAYTVDGLLKKWPNTDYRNWYLGDWLPYPKADAVNPESVDLVNNCSLSQNLAALSEIASILGRDDEAVAFEQRRNELNVIIHNTFYHPENHTYGSGSQIDMAYPMLVGAVPGDIYGDVKDMLLKITEERYGGHIATGLVGVPVLTEWCVRNGECDFMYGMLKKTDCPGYLYMIRNGATATWEDWDNPRSHFHNCFNGIGTWFYQSVGGIVPVDPGYRSFVVSPQIPEGMDWARVSKDTPYGRIEVAWEKKDGNVEYDITVPNCSEARFVDFSGESRSLGPGKYHFD